MLYEPTSTPITSPTDEHELAYFLLWLMGIALIATLIFGILWQTSAQLVFLAIAGLALSVLIGLALAAWLARTRRAQTAISVVFGTLVGAALLCMILAPAMLPVLVLVVLLGVATVLPYAAPQRLTQLLRLTGGVGVILAVLSIYNPLAQPTPPEIITVAVPILVPCLIGAILLLLGLFHRRLTSALAVSQQAVRSLQAAQEQLEAQVQVRTADLQLALQEIEQRADAQAVLLEEVQQQRDTIREMSVPVLPVTRNELVVPLVGALDTVRLAQLREQALAEIERKRTRRLILDVTGVPVVDTFVAQGIVQVVAATRLLGAETVLVGIRPEVAQALVGLGVDLSAIRSYADLASALGRG